MGSGARVPEFLPLLHYLLAECLGMLLTLSVPQLPHPKLVIIRVNHLEGLWSKRMA